MTATEQDVPIRSLLDLGGKVAVVTGSGAGMGKSIAARLAEAGARVVVADIDAARAAATAIEIGSHGGSATSCEIDVRQVSSLGELAAKTVHDRGQLDVWVNNAGIYPPIPVFKATEEDWDRLIDINLRAVYFGTREAARWMIKAGKGGVIVNIASIAAYRAGPPSLAHYAASKAGVIATTMNLAGAFGPYGIRVVGVAPGVIDTDGMRAGGAELDRLGANVGNRADRIPLRRIGSGDDIARVVLFLASHLADFVTGVTIAVDGGDVISGPSDTPPLTALGLS